MERFNFNVYKLISEIRNRPALWDTSCLDYSNKETKKHNWSEIAEILAENGASVTEKRILLLEIQKRWKNLRTCYSREVKRQKQIQAGQPLEDRKTEYLYYKQLQFLHKGVRETDSPDLASDHYEEQTEEEEPPRKVLKVETRQDYDPFQTVYTERPSIDQLSTNYSEVDEDRLFLLSLLSTLNGLPARKKMATKIKILSTLHEATEYND